MFQPPESMLEFVYRLLRGALYAFTFILWILGLSLIVFSFWYIYEGENYHLDNSIKFVVFTVSFVAGFVLLSLSLCGLAGVFKENMCLSKIFLIGMVLLILVELSFVFLIYAYKKEILAHSNTLFQKFISEYADDDDVRVLVDTIQSDLKCCGISSPNDWDRNPYYKCNSVSTLACSVPASCCYNFTSDTKINMFCGVGVRRKEVAHKQYQLIHVTGCKYSIHSFLDYKHKMTSSILTGVLIPQFIGLILIVSFIVSLKFLIEFDSIDRDLLKVIQFERDTKNNLITEIKTTEPSAPPFDEAFDPSAPIAMTEASKNLFSLNIGPNHDFLRRSKRNFNRNHQYRQEQEHVNPSFSAPTGDFISD